jgi:hypothetical protein
MNRQLVMFLTPIAICLGLGGLFIVAISLFGPKRGEPAQQQAQAQPVQQQPAQAQPVQQQAQAQPVQQQPVQQQPAQFQQQNQNQQPQMQEQNQQQLREVTAKEIEAFKAELRGIPAQMKGKFRGINQSWVNIKYGANSPWIGFDIKDKKGDFFQYMITNKQKYSRTLLELEKDTPITLIGKVENHAGLYFFEVQEIQITP